MNLAQQPRATQPFDSLQPRLNGIAARMRSRRALVALVADGREYYAATSQGTDGGDALRLFFPIGCLAKLLTACVVRATVARLGIDLEDPVLPLVGSALGKLELRLEGVTFRHLMEHTHALDGSGNNSLVPIQSTSFLNAYTGRIDLESILQSLSGTVRVGRPGDFCNYSNLGSWIAAALLERLSLAPFSQLLMKELLEPMGIELHDLATARNFGLAAPTFCPAVGGTSAVSLYGLVTFLKAQIACDGMLAHEQAGKLIARILKLPGWNPFERGILLGWKYFGNGWFGHNANLPDSSAIVRVNPGSRTIIIVATQDVSAMTIASALFANELTEIRSVQVPHLLSPGEASQIDAARMCGEYRSLTSAFKIALKQGQLHLQASKRVGGCDVPSFASRLSPARDNILLLVPPQPGRCIFVQPLAAGEREFSYLWDGRGVLKRCGEPDDRPNGGNNVLHD